MFRSGVNMQFGKLLSGQTILGQHPSDSATENLFGTLRSQLGDAGPFQPSRKP